MDSQALEAARAAFDRGEWSVAYARFASLDGRSPLEPDDLDRLASAAYLVGEDAASDQARTRAHARFLEQGDAISAARSAFWLAFTLADRPGQQAQVAGWLARAQRLLDDVTGPLRRARVAAVRFRAPERGRGRSRGGARPLHRGGAGRRPVR